MATELNKLTITEASAGLRGKEFSSVELTEACLSAIEKNDDKLKSFITVDRDGALEQARSADVVLKKKDNDNPLLGVPAAIKDILCTAGLRSTAASKMLENYIPPYDATSVAKLKSAGAVILGKTNLDEFAMGGSTENSAFFPTHNPWDTTRVPGGSSGGSAVAVAADLCTYSLGTDTGGSIRQPASFCGTCGLKVTYGRVSRYGAMAMTSSLDTIGPFAKTVEDLAIVTRAIAGRDERDSTTPAVAVDDYLAGLNQSIEGLRVGLPKEYFIEGMDSNVREIVLAAAKQLENLGAKIIDISLPHTDVAVAAYYIICPSEVSSNMARYDGVRYGHSDQGTGDLLDQYLNSRSQGLGAEVKRRIMIGTYALSAGYYDAYYKKAMQVRTLVKQDFDQVFDQVDVILTPVAPTTAFPLGVNSADPLQMYLADIFTIPASLAGVPALSMPAGLADGLPVGVQLIGARFAEQTILRAGHQFQLATDYHLARPAGF